MGGVELGGNFHFMPRVKSVKYLKKSVTESSKTSSRCQQVDHKTQKNKNKKKTFWPENDVLCNFVSRAKICNGLRSGTKLGNGGESSFISA